MRVFLPLLRRARAALLIALAPAAALAQTGRIAGTVTDSSRVPLSGAQVTVVGTRLGAVSDAAGRWPAS